MLVWDGGRGSVRAWVDAQRSGGAGGEEPGVDTAPQLVTPVARGEGDGQRCDRQQAEGGNHPDRADGGGHVVRHDVGDEGLEQRDTADVPEHSDEDTDDRGGDRAHGRERRRREPAVGGSAHRQRAEHHDEDRRGSSEMRVDEGERERERDER